jgi:hypothetical protein
MMVHEMYKIPGIAIPFENDKPWAACKFCLSNTINFLIKYFNEMDRSDKHSGRINAEQIFEDIADKYPNHDETVLNTTCINDFILAADQKNKGSLDKFDFIMGVM